METNSELNVDGNDWRTHFTSDSRQRILNRIVKILEDHTSQHAPEILLQLSAIATKFEEKVYESAPSQGEYLRRISTKMVNIVGKLQGSGEVNSMQSNSSSNNQNPPDAVSQSVHSQMHNQGKSLPVPLTIPSQAQQSLLSHTVLNNVTSAGVQSSANLVSTLQSVTGLTDNTASNVVGQSCNLQNVSGIPPNSNAQCLPSNILVHAQRQMQGRQHVQQVIAQQHQQPSQNPHPYIYNQQVQNQMLKKRRGNIQPPLLQSHVQQQQQQNLLQPVQLQTSSSLQPNQHSFQQSQPALQSNPLPNLLHPHSSSLQVTPSGLRQQHQSILSPQQKQQIIGKQPEETKTQQNQLLGQPNSSMEMQHQQQQWWLHQQQQQQQQVCQQSDISNFHQQLLGPQQQLIGTRPSVSNIQTNNQTVHVRQAKQMPSKLLSTHGQQSQSSQKQLINQFQTQSPHLQQQMGLEKQQFSIQGDVHQSQISGVLIQPQNVIDQQKQLLQLARARADPSSMTDSITQRGHTNIVDGQEEIHQKFKSMGELYLPHLRAYHNNLMSVIHRQLATTPEAIRQLKLSKRNVEQFMTAFEPSNSSRYSIDTKKTVIDQFETFMKFQSSRIKGSSQQHGLQQFQPPGDHLLKSQVSQLKNHGDQMNSLMQPRETQTLVATIQPTASMPSLLTHMGVSSAHLNVMSTPPNRHHPQSNTNMLNSLNLKQQQEQQTLQAQHVQQRPSSQQLIQQQDQQLLKQQHQQLSLLQHQQQHNLHRQHKLQQSTQSLVHQMPQAHHMSEMNDLKVRQGMGVISGPFQNSAFHHQQIKTGALFSIPSPQPLQAASPQISHHSSPQIDQQSLLTAASKAGTPLQSSNSPSIAPSPSTPVSSSPLTGNPEKQTSGVSSLSNAGNICQTPTPISLPQSHLFIGTPGISASPLLAEVTSTDTNQGNASTIMFEQSSATEKPIERLIKVVKSLSPKTLSASVDEIELATSMVDMIAASAAGNGSGASVGVDFVHSHAKWRKWLRQGNAIPLDVLSSDDSMNYSFKRVNDLETSELELELESTATSKIKRRRIEVNHALIEEVREINQQLINTVVDISDENIKMTAAIGVQGTIVKCSFSTATPSPGLKLHDVSAQMLPVLPMWLLVSSTYPNRSPTFLDKLPVNLSKEYEDLLMKTRSWYSRGLRSQQEPVSLCKMVKDWDVCARAVVSEYALQNGGGTFSTSYGGWEIC